MLIRVYSYVQKCPGIQFFVFLHEDLFFIGRPFLIRFENEERRKGLFKFYNVLPGHENFEQIVQENWGITNLLRDVE